MAKLVKCKTCGNDIAKTAKVCPHCGAKNHRSGGCGVIIVALLILLAIGYIGKSTGSSTTTAPQPSAKTEKPAQPAANPVINKALAYLRKVDGVCRVDIVGYDVFLSYTKNELPGDYRLIANAAAMNGSRALVEARETPSRCTVWVIPAEDPAKVDNAYYTTTARKGKPQK